MKARQNKTLPAKESDEMRLAAVDELQERLDCHIENNRPGNDLNSTGQGRSFRQQLDHQRFNSYIIWVLTILILIAATLWRIF